MAVGLTGKILVQEVTVFVRNKPLLSHIIVVFVCSRYRRAIKQSAHLCFPFQHEVPRSCCNFQSIQPSEANFHFPYFRIFGKVLKGISKFDKLYQNSLLKQLFFNGNTI